MLKFIAGAGGRVAIDGGYWTGGQYTETSGCRYNAAGGLLILNNGTPGHQANGLRFDNLYKKICGIALGTIDHYSQGLPFDSSGRLVFSITTAPAYFENGVPFDVNGRVPCVYLNAGYWSDTSQASDALGLTLL